MVSGEDLSIILPSLIKFLKPGMFLEGTVLKSFPDKNKAIIQLGTRQIAVETSQPLVPGHLFFARVEKSFPQPVLKIISHSDLQEMEPSQLKEKASIQGYSDITSLKSNYNESIPRQLASGDIQKLNLIKGQVIEAKILHMSDEKTAVALIHGKKEIIHFDVN